MLNPLPVFAFLAAKAAQGKRAALVTVMRLDGGSTRDRGAHMAVAEDGTVEGSLSGGCIEAAVAAEALAAIAADCPRTVLFGKGSRFRDIVLPCGGSVTLAINPVDAAAAAHGHALCLRREPFVLTLPLTRGSISLRPGTTSWRTRGRSQAFEVAHVPALRLHLAGHGEALEALVALADTMGIGCVVLTHDRALDARLSARHVAVARLTTADADIALDADAWSAIAFLFHDHEWEVALVPQALASDAFYVGAMGGRITTARRNGRLADLGVPAALTDRLHAPIGLIPDARDPHTLALSALAEIVHAFDRATARSDLEES